MNFSSFSRLIQVTCPDKDTLLLEYNNKNQWFGLAMIILITAASILSFYFMDLHFPELDFLNTQFFNFGTYAIPILAGSLILIALIRQFYNLYAGLDLEFRKAEKAVYKRGKYVCSFGSVEELRMVEIPGSEEAGSTFTLELYSEGEVILQIKSFSTESETAEVKLLIENFIK